MILLLLGLLGCGSETAAGQRALDAHDLAGAEGAFRQALARTPDDAAALAGLGWTYLLAGQVGAASGVFSRCALAAPAEAECLRGQSSVALAENNVPRARGLLLQAQQLAPEDPKVQSSVALMELLSGDVTASEERYRQLVRRHPEEAEYQLGLARLLLRMGEVEEARVLSAGALELGGTALRYQSMLWVIQAQSLLASAAGREDPERCAETAPPVLVWLRAAERALDNAEATGVTPPDLAKVRRQVARRRAGVEDVCPGSANLPG
ncbi:MAG: thioredoxin-like negative regulator of GroEL [Myxococcota bacterium]|jgi:thioredoxin-like negative regulator of GroEL